MLPNFLACHRHLYPSLSPQKKPQQLPRGQSVLAALIDGDKWSSGLIHFFYSPMLLVPSEGGDYSENEIKSYQSRDEYCHSASLSSGIDNQRNCLLLSLKAR